MLLFLLCACLSGIMLVTIDILSYCQKRSGWTRFASTFILFYAQIIASEFLLGSVSLLYQLSLVVLNLLVSLLLLYVLAQKYGRKVFIKYWKNLKQTPGNFITTAKSDPLWSVLLAMGVGLVIWIIFLGIIFPVTDFDGNSYHMTYVAEFIQSHNFYDQATSLVWLTGYPKGGEFIQLWTVAIAHNDMLVDLTQVPFLALGVYALYSVALALGAQKKNARFASLLFLFLPIVINQLKTSYVDVMLCSLFFAGLAMVVRKKQNKLDYVLIGIIFSMLISVKSTGFLFVFVLLPILFWNLYLRYGKKIRGYGQPLMLMIMPTFFGLYWYVKNYILYHSPIYPFGFQAAGINIFPGISFQKFGADAIAQTSLPHSALGRIWYVWTEQKDWYGCLYNYDTNYAGLGPIWFVILIPAFIIAFYIAFKRRSHIYMAVVATIAFLFLIYPSDYYSRYTMFVTSLGILSLGLVLSNISRMGANLVKGLTIVLAVSVIGTNFVLCNFPPLTVKDQLVSVLHGSQRGVVYANLPGKAFTFIESKEVGGDTIAYSSKPYFIYPLWKPDYSNRVIFIPSSSESGWYKSVSQQRVKYVFVTVDSKERKWASHRMKNIYKDDMYEIYQAS